MIFSSNSLLYQPFIFLFWPLWCGCWSHSFRLPFLWLTASDFHGFCMHSQRRPSSSGAYSALVSHLEWIPRIAFLISLTIFQFQEFQKFPRLAQFLELKLYLWLLPPFFIASDKTGTPNACDWHFLFVYFLACFLKPRPQTQQKAVLPV